MPAMAPRKPSTKSSPGARTAKAAASRSSRSPGSGKKPARVQAPGGSASRKPASRKAAPKPKAKTNGKSRQARQSPQTVFTQPTPGGEEKTVAQMLGEVTWLMTQSAAHKTFFLSDLEWLAMAPIMLKQFRVFYATDKTQEEQTGQQEAGSAGGTTGNQKTQSASKPIGVVLWALVDEDVEKRLEAGNAKMRPQDWRSGDRLWVVDIIAPFGGHDEMLKDLKSQVFKDKTLKFRAIVDGKPSVREV